MMMRQQGSRVVANLLFHAVSLAIALYSFVWLKQLGMLSVALLTRMLTSWGLIALASFFLIATLIDLLHLLHLITNRSYNRDSKGAPEWSLLPSLMRCHDMLFVLALFLAFAVSTIFWGLFVYDRELIFPKAFIFPALLNHIQHTFPVIVLVVELIAFGPASASPSRWYVELGMIASVVMAYLQIAVYSYFIAGHWPYPFMSGFTLSFFFMFACGAIVVGLLLGGVLRAIRLYLHPLKTSKRE